MAQCSSTYPFYIYDMNSYIDFPMRTKFVMMRRVESSNLETVRFAHCNDLAGICMINDWPIIPGGEEMDDQLLA